MSSTMLCPRCWGAPAASMAAVCGCCLGVLRVPDEPLTPHFLLSELLRSSLALRHGIANDPPPGVVAALREGAAEMERLRILWGGPVFVTSGYRSPALNAALAGASSTSAHVEGHAWDVVPQRISLRSALEMLLVSALVFDQVIYEGTWLHIGWRKSGVPVPRRQALMMFGGTFLPYDAADPRVH